MSKKKKDNKNFRFVGILVLVILVFIACIYFGYDKFMSSNIKDDKQVEKNKDDSSSKDGSDNTSKDDNTTDTDNNTNEDSADGSEQKTYEFETQTGEDVSLEANKMVEATGFSGASNYKFYLRGTTLYFKNISDPNNEEEILAYDVKDLYLENKEVTAELGANGKIVKENNYITYK